jgi:hypothetical protein
MRFACTPTTSGDGRGERGDGVKKPDATDLGLRYCQRARRQGKTLDEALRQIRGMWAFFERFDADMGAEEPTQAALPSTENGDER